MFPGVWTVELLNQSVAGELSALPVDMQARFQRIVNLVQQHGLDRVREPHVRHVEGRLWEMRLSGREGIARAFYVAARGRRFVVVRVFVKKTEKTPRHEVAIALNRAKEVA